MARVGKGDMDPRAGCTTDDAGCVGAEFIGEGGGGLGEAEKGGETIRRGGGGDEGGRRVGETVGEG